MVGVVERGSSSGRILGGVVISCQVERSDMKAGRQIEFM